MNRDIALLEHSELNEERAMRLRFMRIDSHTSELLREFWKVLERNLPEILDLFYEHVASAPQIGKMIGNDIPRLKRRRVPIGAVYSMGGSTRSTFTVCAKLV
jgi:hypothetical protein